MCEETEETKMTKMTQDMGMPLSERQRIEAMNRMMVPPMPESPAFGMSNVGAKVPEASQEKKKGEIERAFDGIFGALMEHAHALASLKQRIGPVMTPERRDPESVEEVKHDMQPSAMTEKLWHVRQAIQAQTVEVWKVFHRLDL